MRIILNDGRVMDVTDITQPMAVHDYTCAWKPHAIKAGRKYVRVVFKIKGDTELECKHYCPDCWQEMNQD